MAFPSFRSQAVLVSSQNPPNFLGAIIPGSEVAYLHALISPQMHEPAEHLRLTCEKRGIKFIAHKLQGQDPAHIHAALDAVRQNSENLALNLTGGTKFMALAADEWAYATETPVFYVDTALNRLAWRNKTWNYETLPDILDAGVILSLYGYRITESSIGGIVADKRKLLEKMVHFAQSVEGRKAIALLNKCSHEAFGSLTANAPYSPPGSWDELVRVLADNDVLICQQGCLIFASEAERSWCNGLWLEEYVQMILYKLQAEGCIRSFLRSVSVAKASSLQVRNEIDALFTYRNKLYTIECKTSRLSWADQNETAASVLYKADSLHDRLGGVFARAMICSMRDLGEYDKARAKSMRITVVSSTELPDLRQRILKLIRFGE